MGRFEKLNQDIRQLAEKILEDQDLCKLIYYPDNNPLDPSQPAVNGKREIMDKRLILFRPKLPLATETGTYVTIIPSRMRPSKGEHYINTLLTFRIYCHEEIRTIYYYDGNRNVKKGDRPLIIADKIMELMDTVNFSIGKPNLDIVDVISNNDSTFSGYVIGYSDVDFRNQK